MNRDGDLPAAPDIRCVSVVMPVFRDGMRAIALVHAIERLAVPTGVEREILVVDDGSGDGTAERIEAAVGTRVVLHRLPENRGRAAARNAGLAAARGERVLFMDCDCLPVDERLLLDHLRGFVPGVSASIGAVTGDGRGFWHRYQDDASQRRARQHASGLWYGGSSQNLMVSRAALQAIGGFDEAYRTYGFEDRDVQVRLGGVGRVAWADGPGVRHMDALELPVVCRKMREAGGAAAEIFAARHPDAYRALGYAALDARRRAWLRGPARLAGILVSPLARLIAPWLERTWVPYALRRALVRALTGGSYLAGTADPRRLANHPSPDPGPAGSTG